jgi:hypothetical protein
MALDLFKIPTGPRKNYNLRYVEWNSVFKIDQYVFDKAPSLLRE